jgi:serine/threonine protein kinase
MKAQYDILSKTLHSIIYAISDTSVGKAFASKWVWTDMEGKEIAPPFPDRNSIDEQVEVLQFANKINDLIVKFIEKNQYQGNDMLVMERVYPVSSKLLTEIEKGQLISDFEEKLKQLHKSGFVHGDFIRPRMRIPECFENIILTKDGFRLIDTDFSMILNRENVRAFVYKQMDEEKEFAVFKDYFLGAKYEN